MSTLLRRLLPALLLLPVVAVFDVPTASAAEFQLKFASINAGTTPAFAEVQVPFARAIERESGGRIAIDIQPLGGFGKPIELLSLVESGKIDIANTIPGYYAGRFPRTSVMELPTMFDTAEAGTQALWTMYQDGMLAPEYQGLKVLGLYVSAPFAVLVRDPGIATLRDLRGLRIRVAGLTIGLAFARLGLTPLGMPTNLMGSALANDWVDAVSFSMDSAIGTPGKPPGMVIDQISTVIDAHFSGPTQMVIMNGKSYAALPPDLQAIFDRLGGRKLSMESGIARDRAEQAAKAKLQADPKYRFVTLSAADQAEIGRRIAPVFDEWTASVKPLGIDGAQLIKRARDLVAQPAS